MTTSDKILKAREKRYLRILELQDIYQTVVTLKVNYPGNDKNHYLACLIFNAINIEGLPFQYQAMEKDISDDGPYYLFAINEDANLVKEESVKFEESHPLGRFLDIDVYQGQEAISRNIKRKCYICGQPAHICIRSKNHSYDELYTFIENKTLDFYQKLLNDYIDEAIMIELDLDPKFGLVTKNTSGSHDDMDYGLMLKAKEAIMPYFIKIFNYSIKIDDFTHHIEDLRSLGMQAEIAMFKATNQVNAYKGLIFHLGLIISVYANYISRNQEENFVEKIKETAQIFFDLDDKDHVSFGKIAYNEYQIKGAKGEALLGYPHVIEALNIYKDSTDALKTLVFFICHIEDTNLLKRAKSIDFYKKVKKMFCKLKTKNLKEVNQLSKICIDHRLSFGGSADLLIVTIFIKKLMDNHKKIAFI